MGRLKERVEEEEELKCQLHRRFVESKRQVMEEQVNKQVVAHMDTICVRNVCERTLDQVKRQLLFNIFVKLKKILSKRQKCNSLSKTFLLI